MDKLFIILLVLFGIGFIYFLFMVSIQFTRINRINLQLGMDSALQRLSYILTVISLTSSAYLCYYIQIGSEVVVKEYPDRREYAVWEEVLNACLKEKYIERKSEAICVITNAGYKVVE